MLFYPRIPAIASSFIENSNAQQAGIKIKDQIIYINDIEIKYNDEMAGVLSSYSDSFVNVTVLREGEQISLTTKVSADGTIGYYPALLSLNQLEDYGVYKMTSATYSFFGSFPAGLNKACNKLGVILTSLNLY
jgi:regulator of sigma E protease